MLLTPIPVHKLTLSLPSATLKQAELGSCAFTDRIERQALAEMVLPNLLKANAIPSSNIIAKMNRSLKLTLQTNHQRLQLIKTTLNYNKAQLDQAIAANEDELKQLDLDIQNASAIRSPRIKHRIEHLRQENQQLPVFVQSLTQDQRLLGFTGDSKSALIQFIGDDIQSFGGHSFGVVQNTKTGQVTLQPVNTDQLNSTIPTNSSSEFTDALPQLYRSQKVQQHQENLTLRQQEQDQKQSSHFFEKLFGSKNTQTTGAESAGAACCSITSLDELANVGQRTNHDHGEIITPKTSTEIGLTAFVTYASAAGIKIAGDIYANFNAITKDIGIAEKTLALVKIENQATLKKDPEKQRAIQACEFFLQRQKSEANFQKRVAGILSGIGSLSILVGQFVAKVSPIGLYLLSAYGAGHVLHIGKELYKACQDWKSSPADSADQHHFHKKVKNLALALMSWSFYTAGTATLGTMSLGMMGIMIKTGLAPALIIGGIVSLGVGIAGSVVYNNIVSSKRFYPGAPMLSRLDVRNPPSEIEIDKQLRQAQGLRNIAKEYRSITFQEQQNSKPLDVAQYHSLRYVNKLGLYATLGLYPAPFMQNKFKIKEQRTQFIDHTKTAQNKTRLVALGSLFPVERLANPELVKKGTLKFDPVAFAKAKKALLTRDDFDMFAPDRKQLLKSLHSLLDVLENVPKSDQILKLFAKKVLVEHSSLEKKTGTTSENGIIGQHIPTLNTTTWIKPEYSSLFELPDANSNPNSEVNPNTGINTEKKQGSKPPIHHYETGASDGMKILSRKTLDEDSVNALGGLYKTKPCCGAHGYATSPYQGLTFFLRESYTSQSHQDDATIAKLTATLYESIDQYLLYQARNNAKEDIALYANYKKGFI